MLLRMRGYGVWTVVMLVAACGGAERRAASSSGASSDLGARSGTLLWAKPATGPGHCLGIAVAALPDGDAVAIGDFTGEVTFGAGGDSETTFRSETRNPDLFLARYRPDGQLAWAKHVGGPGAEHGRGVAALPDGSVVVVGLSGISNPGDAATFGAGEPTEVSLVAVEGGITSFVAKYDPAGAVVWAKGIDGWGTSRIDGVTVTPDGGAVISGTFTRQLVLGRGESGEVTLTSVGEEDIFLAKLGADGALAWAKRAGGAGSPDGGYAAAALADGHVLVVGTFMSQATFGVGESAEATLSSASADDVFIANYGPDGSLIWAKSAGGLGAESARALALLPDGGALITGYLQAVPTAAEGAVERPLAQSGDPMLVARYDSRGVQLWAKSAVGTGGSYTGFGIASLPDGDGIVIGTFHHEATFGAGESGETTLTSVGASEIFVARHNGDGTLAWAIRVGTERDDSGSGIAVLRDGGVVITGTIADGAFSGPAATFGTSIAALEPGFFIAKFAP